MKTIATVLLMLCVGMAPAWAALGQARESVRADAEQMNGKVTTQEMQGYSIDQVTRGDGSILREFVSPGGQIFGVAWEGFTMPNMNQILGTSAEAFQKAAAPARTHRGPRSVRVGQLVVVTGGHMRDFRVRAYREDMIPKGLTEDVVK